jgi:hypothetical protein
MASMQNNFTGLNFDKIIRRGDRDITSGSKVPTELFQVAIFLSRPVIDELEFLSEENKSNLIKQEPLLSRGSLKKFLEAFPNLCEIEFANQRFIFPLYSQEIFTTQTDAINYIPYFIKLLITQEKLPQEVIKENNTINEDLIKTAIVPLNVSFLERKLDEFKGVIP